MKIIHIKDIPATPVSHNARIGKRVMIDSDRFPPLLNFAQATFPPGEIAFEHEHSDMLEVFYIQSGVAAMRVNGKEYALKAGSCIAIEPGEEHELSNASQTEEMVVLYFGLTVPTGR